MSRRHRIKARQKRIAPSNEPTWDVIRRRINRHAQDRGEWAGMPIPVDNAKLIMEPRYPLAGVHGAKFKRDEDRPFPPLALIEDVTLLNQWYCFERQLHIYVCREADGKSRAYWLSEGAGRRFMYWFDTLGVAAQGVWSEGMELRAQEKLKNMVSEQAWRCYTLTGGFIETSPRSGVSYIFRKLRPTLALRPGPDGNMKIIAVLCMHPLGFYDQTWAGVMCPTDDVIAHLVLMRGDEHRYWRKSNHHPMHAASAGI